MKTPWLAPVCLLLFVVVSCAKTEDPGTTSVVSDCEDCPEMVEIELARWVFGSPINEFRRESVERPQTSEEGCIAAAVGRYEVSQAEYGLCVASGVCATLDKNTGRPNGELAQAHFALAEAIQYTSWLSEYTNKRYYIPTELEWEIFARSGEVRPFYRAFHADPRSHDFGSGSYYCDTANSDCDNRSEYIFDGKDADTTLDHRDYGVENEFGLKSLNGGLYEITLSLDSEYGLAAEVFLRSCSFASDPWLCRFSAVITPDNGGTLEGSEYSGLRVFRELSCAD